MQLTADFQRAWTEGGPKIVVTRSLRKLVRPIVKVGSLVFTECDLHDPMPDRREIKGIIVREATIQDVQLFEDQQLFPERLEQGHRCFMGIEESTGKLTNYRWICTSAPYIPEIDRYLMMKPGGAYAYDLNTLPEFRRRGIDAYTRHYTYSYLRDTGYTKIYAYIHGDNSPSLRASRVLLRPVGRIWYIRPRGRSPIVIGALKSGYPELRRFAPSGQMPKSA